MTGRCFARGETIGWAVIESMPVLLGWESTRGRGWARLVRQVAGRGAMGGLSMFFFMTGDSAEGVAFLLGAAMAAGGYRF